MMIKHSVLVRSTVVLGLLVGLTAGFVGAGLAGEKKTLTQKENSESFARFGFDPEIPGIHEPYFRVLEDNLIKRFGPPLTRKVLRWPAGNTGAKMEEVTLEYSGLSIKLMKNDAEVPPGEYEIMKIDLTSSQHQLKHGLRIGQPKVRFFEKLGPTETYRNERYNNNGRSHIVYVGGGPRGSVTTAIVFDQNDLATEISWTQPEGGE